MRCRLGAGTHFHGNAVIYTESINTLLRGPSPPGGSSGAPRGLKIDTRRSPNSFWNSLGPRLLASWCQRWLRERSLFLRNLPGWILSSQAAPPTLKNDGFIVGKPTFSIQRRFRSEDGFGNVLGLPRGPSGPSGACLGGSLGPLDRPKKASRLILEFSWASFARFLLPKMASGTFAFLSEPLWVDFDLPS